MTRLHPFRSSALFLLACVVFTVGGIARPGAQDNGVVRDTRNWIPWTHVAQPVAKGSALDMSFLLDAPAGRHGFVTVKGERFVFEDGTEARFWGGNFFGEANFPEKTDAERLADIVARSGANIVRMHHLDVVGPWSDKVVRRSLFGGQQAPTTRRIDAAMLDRLEYLVHCLKQRGVYIFLSPVSSRMIRPGDGFPGPPDAAAEIGWGLKFEGMFDPFLIGLQEEYLRALLTHRNPYTGLALKDDPVLALTEVINENTTMWPQEDGPFALTSEYYRTMLQQQFGAWLQKTVGTRQALAARWAAEGRQGLAEMEDPAAATVALPPTYRNRERHRYSDARVRDTFAFLAHLQESYFGRMHAFMKGLGVRAPIAGSNHWTDDLLDLRQNASFDYVDRHEYWTHPEGSYNYEAGQGIQPKPMVKDPRGGAIAGLARRRVHGRPYTVSEWHNCLPNPFRAEGPPLMAAYASLQGWHAMQYAYWAVTDLQPPMINSFEGMFDPTQITTIPASALLFHRRDVREATAAHYDEVRPGTASDPLEQFERHPEIALVGKYGLAFTDLAKPAGNEASLGEAARGRDGVVTASTGELTWRAGQGLTTIDTPRTQGVIGFAGGQAIDTAAVRFELTTPFAVALVSSLTTDPIATSGRLLVSTSADARWTGVDVSPSGDKVLTTGRWPFLVQPVEGRLVLKGRGLVTVHRIGADGTRLGTVETQPGTDGTVVPLDAAHQVMHYEIHRR